MPRVVPEYKEQARNRILNAATAEFLKKGYRNTKMEDIARNVGVSKGALYQYFDTKQELLGYLGERLIDRIVGDFEPALQRGLELEEASVQTFDIMYRAANSMYPNLILDLVYEGPDSKKVRKVMERSIEEAAIRIARLLDERKKTGGIRKDLDTMAIARGLLILQGGHMISLSIGYPVDEIRKSWNETIKAIIAGIR